ncbi:hypothetical protein WDU94_003889 [Cyamophila willieti]
MNPTYYLRRLLRILHIAGLIRLPNYYQEKWKTKLHNGYWYFVHSFIIVFATSNILSILVYSSRDLAEVLQRLFETVSFVGYYYETVCLNIRLTKFLELLDRLDHSLCTRQPNNMLTMNKKEEKMVFVGTCTLMVSIFTAVFAEAFFLPLDETDQELIKYIYDRKYGRKLPGNFYIPGIDLSEPLYYIIFSGVFFYLTCMLLILGTVCFSQFPLFVLNVEVQSIILSRYVRMIGQIHQNEQGEMIRYTNILKDEYVVIKPDVPSTSGFSNVDGIVRFSELRTHLGYLSISYEESYARQVIKFHQRIVSLREDVSNKNLV